MFVVKILVVVIINVFKYKFEPYLLRYIIHYNIRKQFSTDSDVICASCDTENVRAIYGVCVSPGTDYGEIEIKRGDESISARNDLFHRLKSFTACRYLRMGSHPIVSLDRCKTIPNEFIIQYDNSVLYDQPTYEMTFILFIIVVFPLC